MSSTQLLIFLACSGASGHTTRVFEQRRELFGVAGFECNENGTPLRSIQMEIVAKDGATAIGLATLKLIEDEPTRAKASVITVEEGAIKAFHDWASKWSDAEPTKEREPQKWVFVQLHKKHEGRLCFRKPSQSEAEVVGRAKGDAEGPKAELLRRYNASLQTEQSNTVLDNLDSVISYKVGGLKPGDSSIR